MAIGVNPDSEIRPASTNEIQNENKPEEAIGMCTKFRIFFTNITVEPILVLFLLPSVMSVVAIANLDLEKACRVNLEYNETVCDGLTARNSSLYTPKQEETVQKLVASMAAWKNVIKSVLPSILLMFLGSWSDRHKRRKPGILIPIIGEIFTNIGVLTCIYFFYELPMEVNGVAESLPTALAGGWFTMFMAVFSYVSAVSTVETRTVRIGAVNIISHLSFTVGIALSGILLRVIGLYGVFSLALGMYIIGILYAVFVIKEIKSEDEEDQEDKKNKVGFVKDFFNVRHIAETLRVAFKPRQKNWRLRICVIMMLVMVVIGPVHGEFNVIYLFVRYRFGWNEVHFSLYYTYNLILHMLGTIISLTLFSKVLKVDDAVLGMISSTSKVLSCFVYAFAPNSWVFCLGVVVEILNGTSFIALRSIISKLVPPDELGKINSLFGVSEALMPLVYGPMYSLVYKATIDVLPGTFFLVGGGLTIPAIVIFYWLYLEHRRDLKEERENKAQMNELLKREENGNVQPS
ncbi:hypothetical protein ILUMI_21935 [Ignelater luminosus]|uniref:Solute carrier family 46 member 3 n=1 Tax=Ignelater luminosus TaxID=2038154 RepID=A0A8K0CBI7_IGNLU|nr:hypothetical protein ILUMI_21935 [Ignelater luminosus]